jgi:hypothetical protein
MAQGIGEEFGTSPFPELRAGKTGELDSLTSGGVKATGTITFALNPTAAATITMNGTVFTFVAAGATGNQVNIGVDLTTTLSNTATVLNASVLANISVATYTSNATILTTTYDTYVAAGNLFTLAASVATPSAATLTGGQDLGVADISTEPTRMTLTQAVDQRVTLAAGDEAQQKLIYVNTRSGAGNLVVVPSSVTGGTIITFNASGMWVELRYIAGAWVKTAGTATVS